MAVAGGLLIIGIAVIVILIVRRQAITEDECVDDECVDASAPSAEHSMSFILAAAVDDANNGHQAGSPQMSRINVLQMLPESPGTVSSQVQWRNELKLFYEVELPESTKGFPPAHEQEQPRTFEKTNFNLMYVSDANVAGSEVSLMVVRVV